MLLYKLRNYSFAFLLSAFLFPAIGYGRGIGSTFSKRVFFQFIAFVFLFGLASCATPEKSALFGAAMGAASGTGVGVLVEPSAGSAFIGAGIGAVIGGGLGFLFHHESAKPPLSSRTPRPVTNSEVPFLNSPEATCTRVDARIDGTHYYGERVECEIQKAATWSR